MVHLGKYERRTLLLFLLILATFVIIGSSVTYVEQRNELMRQTRLHAEREIELIGKLITESLIKGEYVTTEQFIKQWAQERPELLEVRLTTANGFVLAHHLRVLPTQYSLPLTRQFDYGDQDSVSIEMVWDLTPIYQNLNRLQLMLVAIPVALVVVLLLFLWWVLRRMLLRPIYGELEERERNLSLTLDSIGDAVIATDSNGDITRMNPVAEALTGWHSTEATGRTLLEVFKIINAQTRQPVADPVEKVLRTGGIVGLANHTVLVSKDGSEYQIADSGAPIKDESGKILGVILVFRDVTEEYMLQAALKDNQQRLQSILDNTSAVIYVKDKDGRYLLVNRQFEKLFNMSNEHIHGRTDYDLFPRDLADKFSENDERVLAMQRPMEVEEVVPQENALHTYISIKFPLYDEKNTVNAVCGISTDITERLQAEEALRRSQKMEAIGQLTGGIAHDFNNQLGVIIGYLDFLHEYTAKNKDPRQWVDTATRATQRCMDLTRQLLTFSRRQANVKTAQNLNSTLREMENIVARSVTPEVDVVYSLADDLWLTEIDPGEFQDVILNLVVNARDAMPDGGKLKIETYNITLEAGHSALKHGIEAGDFVQLSVSDTGTGMDKETLEHVFEPFFTTKEKGKGTGLGMAMVYGFVKRYDGCINLRSESGVGTNMHLYLPRSTGFTTTITDAQSHEIELVGGSESILIVDDEVDLLYLADHYLSAFGYRTCLAENAAQALEILEGGQQFDLLFSDVVMPGSMNGYELAQQATQQHANLKVLLTSGFTSKTFAQNDRARFSTHLLAKPYRKADLAQRVRLVLDEGSA